MLKIRGKMLLLTLALVVLIGHMLLSRIAVIEDAEQVFARIGAKSRSAGEALSILSQVDGKIDNLVAETRSADDAAALESAERHLDELVADARRALGRLPIAPQSRRALSSQLAAFHGRARDFIAARADLVDAGAAERAGATRLSRRGDVLVAELEVFRSDRTSVPALSGLNAEEVAARLRDDVRLQTAMARLRDSVTEATSTTTPVRPLVDARSHYNELVRILALHHRGSQRKNVGAALREFGAALQRQGELAAALNASQLQVKAAQAAVDAVRGDTLALLARTVEVSEDRVAEDRLRYLAESRTQTRHSALASAVVSGVILLLVWWVTDRRVVHRLERLTADMQRIADGELDAPVRHEGRDEIGEMSTALAHFRTNAIELRRSNHELGNFAYAASHDLRSPLRAIGNLAEWTIEDAGDSLGDEVRSNLVLIRERAERLSRLLSDLLAYARAGQDDLESELIHLPGLVRDVAVMADPELRFDIDFEGERCLWASAVPLTTILRNLVSNAVKHHDKPTGRIVVRHDIRENRSLITVSDDGPGIEPRYQKQVFDLFQTLGGIDKDGSGMGLAMVRKLAEELGGRVTLRSDPDAGRGAEFMIDIPLHDKVRGTEAIRHDWPRGAAA